MGMTKQRIFEVLRYKWESQGDCEWSVGQNEASLELVIWPIFNEYMPETWSHASTHLLLHGKRKSSDIDSISGAIDEYLVRPQLHAPQLDWVLADAAVFAETNSASHAILPSKLYDNEGRQKPWRLLGAGMLSFLLWIAWLAVAYLAYTWSPFAIGVLAAYTAIYQYGKDRDRRKKIDLIESMADVYGALDSVHPSWRNVYGLMEASRSKGAKWPTPLYKLVEKNIVAYKNPA